MWRILRNTKTGENEETVNSLERYFSALKNKLPAKFRISKKIPIETELKSGKNELWQAHRSGVEKFREKIVEIDEGKTKLSELEEPETSLLDLKEELAARMLKSCHFCERKCNVNRKEGETGVCGVEKIPRIASEFVHHGEEPELVPSYTIFFSGCTFECQFCQNWNISQSPNSGVESSPEKIASLMTERRQEGVKNVNWVGGDPTPNLHAILASLNKCEANIPSVWNSNMYLSKAGMKLLFGTQDVYLTDFKYGNNECALKYSKVPNYWEVVSRNHKLAFEDAELIIRHLVLPEHVECCTEKIFKWIKEELGPKVRVNVLGQYRPAGKARDYPELSRRVSGEEMNRAYKIADEIGLENTIR